LFKKKSYQWLVLPAAMLLLLAILLTGCGQSNAANTPPASSTQATTSSTTTSPVSSGTQALNGAGGTFPAPLYTKWFDVYNQLTGVKINYQAVGSGAGIQAITAGTVDFGASDAIMTDQQQAAAEAAGGPILHIPMTSGSVAIIYNLSGISSGEMKLDADVLAKIYLKKITRWNDPAIAALNPGLNLPNEDIAVVHRSDGSGTTFIFTNYLSKVSQEWSTSIGNATSVNWPGDLGGQGNAGVAGVVQQTPGAIGYVEQAYADQNNLPWVLLKNAAGNYEKPSLDGVTKSTEGVPLPDDMKIMITNSTNPDAYPICGFTWILAYVNQKDKAKGLALVNMLWWAIHDGQQYGPPLDYAPLSGAAAAKAENEILSIKYQGQALLTR
jgi:phosphate transport system substrate-binding protein